MRSSEHWILQHSGAVDNRPIPHWVRISQRHYENERCSFASWKPGKGQTKTRVRVIAHAPRWEGVWLLREPRPQPGRTATAETYRPFTNVESKQTHLRAQDDVLFFIGSVPLEAVVNSLPGVLVGVSNPQAERGLVVLDNDVRQRPGAPLVRLELWLQRQPRMGKQ